MEVSIQLREGNYDTYWEQSVALTTTEQTYTLRDIVLDHTSDNIGLMFKFGESTTNFWLDDIHFGEQDCSTTTVAYQWQSRTADGADDWNNWAIIPGATSETYDPLAINVSTQYRREAKTSACTNWSASNIVTVETCPAQFICDAKFYQTIEINNDYCCLLYTSPSPRDATLSRMPSSA